MAKKSHEQKPLEQRGAGILLHITSLPSPFAIGDIGPEAYRFADFLQRCGQKFWQLLPLNPIEKAQSYSPYSATSSMAGNTWLISPELLVEDGFLKRSDIDKYREKSNDKADYETAKRIKEKLLAKAYKNFKRKAVGEWHDRYNHFCTTEAYWLKDYSHYSLLKKLNKDKPWFSWAQAQRKPSTISKIKQDWEDEIEPIAFAQFLFFHQWQKLKAYCNERGIYLIGDVPFYVSYDSADVWANQDIFNLNEDGSAQGIAGVPPDYFNADGQLWGMPVFNWHELKQQKYAWWIQRMRKNIECFDIVRLDHFRAFADYWEVPASETTAKHGKWKKGPRADFFNVLKRELGDLPFIAEDLGDINDPVLDLRDKFKLPGMKVLHFAFGDNIKESDYAPHNYIHNAVVYTGTHDNNTTVGWFKKDATRIEKQNLNLYLGKKVSADTVTHELLRLAYASVANIAIIPMQDVLSLDERSRMNMPASTSGNWVWRLKSSYATDNIEKFIRSLSEIYKRQ